MTFWAEVEQVFRECGARYALAGAVAANLYRDAPRATSDVDVLAEYRPGLVAAFQARGWDARVIGPADAPFLVRLARGADRLDVLVAETAYQRQALTRAADGVLTAEDVVVHKLIAGRPHDIDDIRGILTAGVRLDRAYVESWAQAWEVMDRWRALMGGAG